jgi:hypothetical protein
MRKTLAALVLVLALCSTAFAGDIPSPPAPDGSTSQASDTEGSTETEAPAPTDDTASGDNADGFAAAALSVIHSVLALL